MLKRETSGKAVLVSAAFLVAYIGIAVWGEAPHIHVCEKDYYTGAKDCSSYDILRGVLLLLVSLANRYNGLVAALAGVAVAAFTGVLWIATERLWKQGREVMVETRSGERAWVTTSFLQFSVNIDPNGVRTAQVQIKWENSGRTPAMDMRVRIGGDTYQDYDESIAGTVVGPGTFTHTTKFNIDLVEAFTTRKEYVVKSEALYKDIFYDTIRKSEVIYKGQFIGTVDPMTLPEDEKLTDRIAGGFTFVTLSQTST